MPWGSPQTRPISQPAAPRRFHHPNTASSIPALEQYHKSGRTTHQLPEASREIAVSPHHGAQASLSHCCWMATWPHGALGRERGTSAPQTQQQSSRSPRAGHTPPWGPSPTQAPVLPRRGAGSCATPPQHPNSCCTS